MQRIYVGYVGRVLHLRRSTHARRMLILTAYFPRAGLGHRGKGWIV